MANERGAGTGGHTRRWAALFAPWTGALLCVASQSATAQRSPDSSSNNVVVIDTFAAVRQVEEVVLAQELATLGRAKQYPLTLAAAAQILQNNPIRRLVRSRRQDGLPVRVSGADNKRRSARPDLDPPGILREARVMARGDATTLAVLRQIERRRPPRTRGAVGGPRVLEDTVAAGASHEHEIFFAGRQPAIVVVVGDGDTQLGCSAHDDSGMLLAADSTGGRRCVLKWLPTRTASVRVLISNPGRVWNSYLLTTN